MVLRGAPGESHFRDAAGTALYQIGARHPEARARVVEVFAEFYEALREDDDFDAPELAAGLAREAARTGDSRVDAAVRAAHAAGIWDEMISDFERYEDDRAGLAWGLSDPIREASLDAVLANPWWARSE